VWLRHVVVPPPALVVRPKRLALRCSFPLWPAAHPSAPKGLPEKQKAKAKTQKDRFRAIRKDVVLACPGQGSSVLGPSRPSPSGAPPAATQP